MIPITTAALTDVGKSRKRNEDSYFLNGSDIFGVLDGVGGGAGGQVASQTAAIFLKQGSENLRGRAKARAVLRSLLQEADDLLLEKVVSSPKLKGMGTTATVVCIQSTPEEGFVAHFAILGDSRVYLFRDGRLIQLGIDQSWVNAQIKNGFYPTPQEKKEYGAAISACLGSGQGDLADSYAFTLKEKDILVTCSDGLSGELSHSRMRKIIATVLQKCLSCEDFVDDLNREFVQAANNVGGHDNITVISSVIGNSLPAHVPGQGNVFKNVSWILGHHSGLLELYSHLDEIKEKSHFFSEQNFLAGSHGYVNYLHDYDGMKESLQLADFEVDALWSKVIEELQKKVEAYKMRLSVPKMEAKAFVSVATHMAPASPKSRQKTALFVLSSVAALLLCLIGIQFIPAAVEINTFPGLSEYTSHDFAEKRDLQGKPTSHSEKAFSYIAHSYLNDYPGEPPVALNKSRLSPEIYDHYKLAISLNSMRLAVAGHITTKQTEAVERVATRLKKLESSPFVGSLATVNLILLEAVYTQKTGRYLFPQKEVLKRTGAVLSRGASGQPYSFLWALYSHAKSGGRLKKGFQNTLGRLVRSYVESPLAYFVALYTQSFLAKADVWQALHFDTESMVHFKAPYGLFPMRQLTSFFPQSGLHPKLSFYVRGKKKVTHLVCYSTLLLQESLKSCPEITGIIKYFSSIRKEVKANLAFIWAFYHFKDSYNLNERPVIFQQGRSLSAKNNLLSYKPYLELSRLRQLENTGMPGRNLKAEILRAIKDFPWFSPFYKAFLKGSTEDIKL